ncbi:hypothetical protein [Sphingobium sp. EM0848]|uniref:hypothetical protein n=1 Tax=Sphingobium sp. EM0848 TaxID=2743473 RepID=UPI00159C5BE1|nr:hypothetical protein [Sphingobium sp. EM0848]
MSRIMTSAGTPTCASVQDAMGWTKYSANKRLRNAASAFDTSTAPESLAFAGSEVCEGVASYREKLAPVFVSLKRD